MECATKRGRCPGFVRGKKDEHHDGGLTQLIVVGPRHLAEFLDGLLQKRLRLFDLDLVDYFSLFVVEAAQEGSRAEKASKAGPV